jgi:NAD-dependent deacetylase
MIKKLAKKITETRNTVVFTGAGMSTESGLSDFRSKNGIWNVEDPMELATTEAMRSNYDKFHAFYSRRFELMDGALPNIGHKILARLESLGLIRCIITQNIDGLHASAGSKNIYELHGSVESVRCMECDAPSPKESFVSRERCGVCGGKLRPGVVLFGESLPAEVLEASWKASESAGVFIVLGSSLQVSPANQMPAIAKRSGAFVAICNKDVTPVDNLADYRTDEGIGDFLSKLAKELEVAL